MSKELAGTLKRVLACVSLANLLALHIWLFLFRSAQEAPLPGTAFAGAIVALLVLAVALWVVSWLQDRTPISEKWRQGIRLSGLSFVWLLIIWAAVKPSIHQELQHLVGLLSKEIVGAAAAFLLSVGMALLWRCAGRAVTVMTTIALLLSPYAAINVVHAAWEIAQRGLSPENAPVVQVPTLAAGEHRIRTVVLLFDEFDYELAFDPSVRRNPLPALDGLRSLALFATQAYPPMHSTAMSIPAMLTGRLVKEGVGSNAHPGDIELRFDDGRSELWSAQESLFTDMRTKGLTSLRLNDALFPHIKLAGPADADIVVPPAPAHLLTVTDHASSHLLTVAALLPFAKGNALDVRLGRLIGLPPPSDHVTQVAMQIVDLVGDARSDLLFLHILLPHMPVVFDLNEGRFGATISSDYRDNFLGVDYVIHQIIERLRERGRLAETHLFITSDHFFRPKRASYGLGDHRIPFIAIFAGDNAPFGDFNKPFNTILFRRMLGDIAEGEIQDSPTLARWLEAHATYGESPLTEYRKGW